MALTMGIMPHAASDHDLDELRARLDFLARCVLGVLTSKQLRSCSTQSSLCPPSLPLRSNESAAELLARCYVAPLHLGVPAVDRFASLRPGHVLECVGAASCGKTRLLVQAAVTCILPPTHGGVRYGGNAGAAVAVSLCSPQLSD